MKLSRSARIALSAWVVSLLSYSLAQACTPAPPAIQVKCSNTEVPILAPEDAYKKLSDIAALCNENLAPVISTFEQRIAESFRISRLLLLRRELILEPYSPAREAQIQSAQPQSDYFALLDRLSRVNHSRRRSVATISEETTHHESTRGNH